MLHVRRYEHPVGQVGGAVARKRVRTIDKVAEGMSMFLAGPNPSFVGVGKLLGQQAFKGVKDNVDYYLTPRRTASHLPPSQRRYVESL